MSKLKQVREAHDKAEAAKPKPFRLNSADTLGGGRVVAQVGYDGQVRIEACVLNEEHAKGLLAWLQDITQ